MSQQSPNKNEFSEYLQEIAGGLSHNAYRERFLEELENHLEDSLHHYHLTNTSGSSEESAEQTMVNNLGEANLVHKEFNRTIRQMHPVWQTVLILLTSTIVFTGSVLFTVPFVMLVSTLLDGGQLESIISLITPAFIFLLLFLVCSMIVHLLLSEIRNVTTKPFHKIIQTSILILPTFLVLFVNQYSLLGYDPGGIISILQIIVIIAGFIINAAWFAFIGIWIPKNWRNYLSLNGTPITPLLRIYFISILSVIFISTISFFYLGAWIEPNIIQNSRILYTIFTVLLSIKAILLSELLFIVGTINILILALSGYYLQRWHTREHLKHWLNIPWLALTCIVLILQIYIPLPPVESRNAITWEVAYTDITKPVWYEHGWRQRISIIYSTILFGNHAAYPNGVITTETGFSTVSNALYNNEDIQPLTAIRIEKLTGSNQSIQASYTAQPEDTIFESSDTHHRFTCYNSDGKKTKKPFNSNCYSLFIDDLEISHKNHSEVQFFDGALSENGNYAIITATLPGSGIEHYYSISL